MQEKKKKRVFLRHKKSSALVVSILVHGALILVALTFVAVRVVIKPEQAFETKEVKRPNMKLRKLQVPVKEHKKQQAPKLRKNIVAKPKLKNFTITMPEVVGVPGGVGGGSGGGLGGLGFNFDMDLFGKNKGTGTEFIGHFYDLKQDKDGSLSEIGELMASANGDWDHPNYRESRKKYQEVVKNFLNGWNDHRLDDFFMAQREKFSTSFMIPILDAEEAPKAYGVQDLVKPMEWLALYHGYICAPESGKYRFVGRGDDVLAVRVKKRLVIDASWVRLAEWESSAPENETYASYNDSKRCIVGDWFHLQKGRPVPMDVLIGEEPGGHFFCQLYIQKQDVDYPVVTETYQDDEGKSHTVERPILPVFKTAEIPPEIATKMKIKPEWATIEGPAYGQSK